MLNAIMGFYMNHYMICSVISYICIFGYVTYLTLTQQEAAEPEYED